MKKNIITIAVSMGIALTIFYSCKKDEVTPVDPLQGLVKLSEGYATGAAAKLEIWGEKNYFAGYNNLIAVVYDSLKPTTKLTDVHIMFKPLMTMNMGGGMIKQHTAPVENPAEEALNDVFPGAVVFTMPSSTSGSWALGAMVHNHLTGNSGTATFNIVVDNPEQTVCKSFISQSSDSSKVIVAIIQPQHPLVGMNDIEFSVHKMVDMMTFNALDNLTMEMTPEMPSMGHGSPNNANPVASGNGHYKGKVNFTMTGDWKVNLVVKQNGVAVSKGLYFNISL